MPWPPELRLRRLGRRLAASLSRLLQLALVGAAVGLACWPLNLLDRCQDSLLQRLPAFGGAWNGTALLLLLAPLPLLPVLLLLQARIWPQGAGSGIPQTLVCLEQPQHTPQLMALSATLQRLGLWAIATLALLPLGREGPVVHLGAVVLVALRRRWPTLLAWLGHPERLAVAGAAGLAGGFNTPLTAVIFLVEELLGRMLPRLLWPALVVAVLAALVSSLGGQPLFALGVLAQAVPEPLQLLWALPLGLLAGLCGAVMAALVLAVSDRLGPSLQRRPLRLGLVLGSALALLALASGGAGGGDGEALMVALLRGQGLHGFSVAALLARLLGPALALGAAVPGGLIDPALALGALLGRLLGDPLGLGPLAPALAMAAALAGATQLPVVSLMFSLRLAGDQQLLPGVLLAAVLGAGVGRLVLRRPVYHALADRLGAAISPLPPATAGTPPPAAG
jgi:H+/Cl- antiporter ClcA